MGYQNRSIVVLGSISVEEAEGRNRCRFDEASKIKVSTCAYGQWCGKPFWSGGLVAWFQFRHVITSIRLSHQIRKKMYILL